MVSDILGSSRGESRLAMVGHRAVVGSGGVPVLSVARARRRPPSRRAVSSEPEIVITTPGPLVPSRCSATRSGRCGHRTVAAHVLAAKGWGPVPLRAGLGYTAGNYHPAGSRFRPRTGSRWWRAGGLGCAERRGQPGQQRHRLLWRRWSGRVRDHHPLFARRDRRGPHRVVEQDHAAVRPGDAVQPGARSGRGRALATCASGIGRRRGRPTVSRRDPTTSICATDRRIVGVPSSWAPTSLRDWPSQRTTGGDAALPVASGSRQRVPADHARARARHTHNPGHPARCGAGTGVDLSALRACGPAPSPSTSPASHPPPTVS